MVNFFFWFVSARIPVDTRGFSKFNQQVDIVKNVLYLVAFEVDYVNVVFVLQYKQTWRTRIFVN
jgi:hypothetical protein